MHDPSLRQPLPGPVPDELRKEVEESLRAFAQTQKVLKQIAHLNLELALRFRQTPI